MSTRDNSESSTEGSDYVPAEPASDENEIVEALGISMAEPPHSPSLTGKKGVVEEQYNVVPNPEADNVDLSALRGVKAPENATATETQKATEKNDELQALAELVPALKTRDPSSEGVLEETLDAKPKAVIKEEEAGVEVDNEGAPDVAVVEPKPDTEDENLKSTLTQPSGADKEGEKVKPLMQGNLAVPNEFVKLDVKEDGVSQSSVEVGSPDAVESSQEEQNLGGFEDVESSNNDAGSSNNALDSEEGGDGYQLGRDTKPYAPRQTQAAASGGDYPRMSSAASISTATQTHEVRMPMYLPTFKPATGCTNASDFIVRCFVARLRAGITVVKHGRSRWCKSRLRILHVHPDGRSLSWKPAIGEPTSSKRPPKLDLSTCTEVRHAWSPDPMNPVFTGTPILRQKCEAANAHKSFALIFPKRTVDITAVTADQCKVLMEGFSALCFRLQVASLAGRSKRNPDGDAEENSTTASNTLTNTSAVQISPSNSGVGAKNKRGSR